MFFESEFVQIYQSWIGFEDICTHFEPFHRESSYLCHIKTNGGKL